MKPKRGKGNVQVIIDTSIIIVDNTIRKGNKTKNTRLEVGR